ncbi:sensor histidine kinase [Fibrella forsythiae]|uniref:Histidine kinase n=1 Tax=Fibrella forsythiae TaxID=2817061 RepID=A0ABS3JRF8_9BACT|nr:histidine kinase [Fibrella forsythiae]MBO0952594.1 histidine kinase [Fibrella forsythiae]
MERPNDKWLRSVFIPLIALVFVVISYSDSLTLDWIQAVAWWIANSLFGLVMWEVSMQWLLFVRRRHNRIEQTRQRVMTTFIGYMLIVVACQSAYIQLVKVANLNAVPITAAMYLKSFGIGLFSLLLVGSALEFKYYMARYREAIQESENMKKAGLQSQYDSLKNQVNPHFLFNSLNSLNALISEDREKAGMFLDELSSVYRYLLQASQRPLVILTDEVAFLDAYRYLLDMRFGEALRWEIRLDESYMDYWLPPLTIQTLVENALRLNIALPECPLTLHITIPSPGTLAVCNTIQRKKVAVLGQQGGLTMLAKRYVSLGLPAPVIEDDGDQFTVRLPLTPKEQIPDVPIDTPGHASSL